jgi:hypothetical protein
MIIIGAIITYVTISLLKWFFEKYYIYILVLYIYVIPRTISIFYEQKWNRTNRNKILLVILNWW